MLFLVQGINWYHLNNIFQYECTGRTVVYLFINMHPQLTICIGFKYFEGFIAFLTCCIEAKSLLLCTLQDPYLHRPLPHLIGSVNFMHDENVGLIEESGESIFPLGQNNFLKYEKVERILDWISIIGSPLMPSPIVTR